MPNKILKLRIGVKNHESFVAMNLLDELQIQWEIGITDHVHVTFPLLALVLQARKLRSGNPVKLCSLETQVATIPIPISSQY